MAPIFRRLFSCSNLGRGVEDSKKATGKQLTKTKLQIQYLTEL